MNKQAELFATFVREIQALGGTVQPMLTHDDPLDVWVPAQHHVRAKYLMAQFRIDLEKLGG